MPSSPQTPPKKKQKTFCVCVWGERDRERIPMPVLSGLIFCLFVSGGWAENTTQPEIAIVTAPHHVIVERKSPLLLNCSVVTSKTFGPLEFRWKKNGEFLELDRRIQILQNGSLFFRRIVHRKRRENRSSDEGLYECVAGNSKGRVVARRVRVEVAGKCHFCLSSFLSAHSHHTRFRDESKIEIRHLFQRSLSQITSHLPIRNSDLIIGDFRC